MAFGVGVLTSVTSFGWKRYNLGVVPGSINNFWTFPAVTGGGGLRGL